MKFLTLNNIFNICTYFWWFSDYFYNICADFSEIFGHVNNIFNNLYDFFTDLGTF